MTSQSSMLDLLEQQATLLCQPPSNARDLAIIHTTRQMVMLLKQQRQAEHLTFEAIEFARKQARETFLRTPRS